MRSGNSDEGAQGAQRDRQRRQVEHALGRDVADDAERAFDLRRLTGKDEAVRVYLEGHADVLAMYDDIRRYLETWLPKFEQNNRIYMTVAIGCTGGQHRSVYMAEKLGNHFRSNIANVLVRHRELEQRF